MTGIAAEELDCRLSLIMAALLAAVTIALKSAAGLSTILVCSVFFLILARCNIIYFAKRLFALQLFLLLVICVIPFSISGSPMFEIGLGTHRVSYSREGLAHAGVIWGKATLIFIACWSLLGTRHPSEIGIALRRLGVPAKLASLIFMSAQFIDELKIELSKLRMAMMARGYVVRLSGHSLRHIGYLLGNVLVRSLDRSETVLEAMQARGFSGNFPSLKRNDGFKKIDVVSFTVLVIAGVVAVWLDYWRVG